MDRWMYFLPPKKIDKKDRLLEKMVTNSSSDRAWRTGRRTGPGEMDASTSAAGEPGEMDASTPALAVGVSYGLQFHYS